MSMFSASSTRAARAGPSSRTAPRPGTCAPGPSASRPGRVHPSRRGSTGNRGGSSASAGHRSPAPPGPFSSSRKRRARSRNSGRCTPPTAWAARGCGRRRRRRRRRRPGGSRGSACPQAIVSAICVSPCATVIVGRRYGRRRPAFPSSAPVGEDGRPWPASRTPTPLRCSPRHRRRSAKIGDPPINIFRMLAGGEGLLRAFSRFGNHLLFKSEARPGAAGDRHRARRRAVRRDVRGVPARPHQPRASA